MRRASLALGAVALAAALAAAPAETAAQVFLASRPGSGLAVRPLFITADVAPGVADVPVQVLFSLAIPPDRSALALEQDLFLLWPGPIAATAEGPGFELPPAVAAQVRVVGRGRARLQVQRHYEAAADTETLAEGAPFVTVVRAGGAMSQSLAATYLRLPWHPRLANQAWLTSLHFTARGLVTPLPSTWAGRLVSGPRNTLTLGFNDVGAPAMFSMYYWQRDNVLPVASPARIVARFAQADRLAVDQMFPPAARREPGAAASGTDVSLFLTPADGLTPQVLRVQFGYFSGLQSWGPVLVPALFFALGNVAAVLVRGAAERMHRRLAGWLQLGPRRAASEGLETGTVLRRERLGAIVPGETTYEQVLALGGTEVEERVDLARPERKTLVYRGRRDVPHRRWAWRTWLAAVDHWDVESHEVEIVVEHGVVQNIQVRVGRARRIQV